MGAIAAGRRAGRARGRGLAIVIATVAVAAAVLVLAPPRAAPVGAAPLDYIEVTSTCSLAEAITIANAGSLNGPGNPQGGPTDDCPDHALGTTTIRITASSGTVDNPVVWGVSSAGVALDPVDKQGALVGGMRSILPTITGNNIVIEGDPTNPNRPNGYSIAILPAPPSGCFVNPNTGEIDPSCATINVRGPRGRILDIGAGATVTLRNLNLGGGEVVGDEGSPATGIAAGGAIYSLGALTLDHVTLLGNTVTGTKNTTASGGAVYAAGALTVTSSVFEGNSATGGDGNGRGRSGHALGGAVGLGPDATATISDSIFLDNQAHGGTGQAGSSGRNGVDGYDGRNGRCTSQDTDAAEGQDGGDGTNGIRGRDGDPGGDAVGVIAGGQRIAIDHSSFVGSVAVAGAAGVGGFGGNGGNGGNGGRGRNCTTDNVSSGAPWETWNGDGGNGGHGGDDGWNGMPGQRGTAVATISANAADANADTDLALVDVTISGGSAMVPVDNFGTYDVGDWYTRRTQTLSPAAGSGGAGGAADNGNDGTTGAGGLWDQTVLGRESLVGLGEAQAFGRAGLAEDVSYSTIVGVATTVPKEEAYRADRTTPAGATLAAGQVKGSIVWNPDAGGCPSLVSRGYNVFANTGCQGSAGLTATDVAEAQRPVDPTEAPLGNVIRPANRPGDDDRMPMLPIRQGSLARNRAPHGSPGVSGPCAVLGVAGSLADDGRRGARSDAFCDSGAYEEDGTVAFVALQGPSVLYRGTSPGTYAVLVPAFPGTGTVLTLSVTGIDGVEFPAGFQLTANDADPSFSEASLALDPGRPYPIGLGFQLTAPPSPTTSVLLDARIDFTSNGTVTATPLPVAVRDDGQLDVAISAPDRWSPCSGYLPITYTAGSVGHSPAPPATIRVWPNIVRPNTANGLQTPAGEASIFPPLVYPSAGTSAVVLADGSVLWSTPALTAGSTPPTLRVYVAVGLIDLSQSIYQSGLDVLATSSIDYAPGSGNSFTALLPERKYIEIGADLDLLGGAVAHIAGVPEPDVTVKAGSTGTLYATIDPEPCAAPTTRPHNWGSIHLTVRDPETNRTLIDDLATNNLAVAGDRWFPFTLTAPTTPGIHQLEFTYTSIGEDPVTVLVPYTAEPVGLSVDDAGSAPESTTTRIFTVALEQAVDSNVTVNWKVAQGTATLPDDVDPQSGVLTILRGATSATFTVDIVDDAVPEPDESFFAVISPVTQQPLPAEVKIVDSFGTAGITNDDVALGVADVSVTEGSSGTTDMVFTVTSSLANPFACSVRVATVLDGTAAAADLAALDQEIVIPAGVVAFPVHVAVTADIVAEATETFHLRLTPASATPCGIADGSALGRIVDDDVAALSVGDVTVTEGTGAATTPATFTIGLATTADHAVTVHVATSPGTADAADFTATSTDVTIPAGSSSATVTVPVAADAVFEPDETFVVTLSSPVGAPIGTATAVGTITDDDVPAVSVAAVTVTEGSGGGTTVAPVPITLAEPSPRPVTVTVGVDACSAVDGNAATATVTFAPGTTTADAAIPVAADDVPEADVTCAVMVTAIDAAPGTGASGSLTVSDDDEFVVSGDPNVRVGEGGGRAHVTATLNAPAPEGGITFDYATADGTATAPGDYQGVSGTATIPAGATSVTVDVQISDDRVHENAESFSVVLSSPRRAALQSLARSHTEEATLRVAVSATVTIDDDDPLPADPQSSPPTDAPDPPTGTELPTTGADIAAIIVLAAAAIAGGVLLRRSRRRPTTR